MKKKSNKFTYFGFKKIKKKQKSIFVKKVFDDIYNKYDLMNDIMSFGFHRIWKQIFIKNSNVLNGYKILDVAGGTGDLTEKFSYLVGDTGKIFILDININMLQLGRDKLRNKGLIKNIFYIQADAEYMPFIDNYFNCVSISFGLRNFTDKKKALLSIFRVLKKGGNLIILEFSKPKYKWLSKIYNMYSFYFLPKIGSLIASNNTSYKYLVESIKLHPNQKKLKYMMIELGFKNVSYYNLMGGIVSIHQGFKF